MTMTDKTVIEAHTSNGVTLPMRVQTAAKTGNRYFGLLAKRKDGSRYFTPRGVDLPVAAFGGLDDITAVKVPDLGIDANVLRDLSEKGKPRISATHTFTGDDGQEWNFRFRATLVNPQVVNVSASVNRKGGFAAKTADNCTALDEL